MKRVFALLTACLMVIGCFTINITAKASGVNWSDDAVRATAFSSRDDSSKTIEIASAAELGLLAYEVNQGEQFQGYTITLTADIDLSGYNWDPIGHYTESYIDSSVSAFRGCFDGNGHTISNMNIQISSVDDNNSAFGLFGGVVNGCVKNLSMANATVEIGDSGKNINAGTVAGFFAGSEVADITVTNSPIKASGKEYVYVGGVSGCVYNSGTWDESSLNNIFVSDITLSAVTPNERFRGGVTGYGNESYAAFNNCYTKDITFVETAAQNDYDASGSIVGFGNLSVLNYCYYEGEAAVGVNGPFASQISNTSKVIDGKLEAPVTINNTTYETLVKAMNAWVENNGGHTWDCNSLGIEHNLEVVYLDETYHQWKCKDCPYSINEEHVSVLQGQKDATCTSEGYTGDEVCSVCNEIVKKGEVTEKLAHHYVNGKCTVCGAADPEYKGPGETSAGADKNVSTGNSGNMEKASSPRTGDEAPIVLWIGMLAAACVAVGGSLAYRKKCKKN